MEFIGNKKEFENIPLKDKRFQFWMETVPADIRRLEYELFCVYRKIFHTETYRIDNQEKHGRFVILPEIPEELEYELWEEYKESFLTGTDRKKRFAEIVERVHQDIPALLQRYAENIPIQKIQMIAISGSSFYGPRKKNQRLSDVDLTFLLDDKSDDFNFEFFHENKEESNEVVYHLFGTGLTDEARGENRVVHWLLSPFFPVQLNISNEELKRIIEAIVADTNKRKHDILRKLMEARVILEEKSKEQILE